MPEPGPESRIEALIAAVEQGDDAVALDAARDAYAAFVSGDLTLDDPALSPDFRWEPPARSPNAGVYEGTNEAQGAFEGFREPFEEFDWTPHGVTIGEGLLLVEGEMRGTGRASGIEVSTGEWHVWTLRDGRVARLQMFLDRDEALEAAGLSPER